MAGLKEDSVTEIEARLNRLEHALQDKYSSIGKGVLALAERRNKEVNDLVDQIIETKTELSKIRGELSCGKCMSTNAPDSRFCKKCGAPLPQKNDEKENQHGNPKKR